MLACVISDEPVPQFLLEMTENYRTLGTVPNYELSLSPALRLFAIMSHLFKLCIPAKQNASRTPLHTISLIMHSDEALQSWASSVPKEWLFNSSLNGPGHVYRNSWIAKTWNYYRLGRIVANKAIVDNLDALSLSVPMSQPAVNAKFNIQYSRSLAVISAVPQEIYDSLPFMFGLYHTGYSSIPISLDVFFIITILQSLLKLTSKSEVMRNWRSPAYQVLEQKFAIARDTVVRHLQ